MGVEHRGLKAGMAQQFQLEADVKTHSVEYLEFLCLSDGESYG